MSRSLFRVGFLIIIVLPLFAPAPSRFEIFFSYFSFDHQRRVAGRNVVPSSFSRGNQKVHSLFTSSPDEVEEGHIIFLVFRFDLERALFIHQSFKVFYHHGGYPSPPFRWPRFLLLLGAPFCGDQGSVISLATSPAPFGAFMLKSTGFCEFAVAITA